MWNINLPIYLPVVVFCSLTCRGSCGSALLRHGCRLWASSSLWVRKVYSQWEGQNWGSRVTFNHASGACWMISISVENNGNKCQTQDPTQSPGRGAHSHIGPGNQHKSAPAAQYVNYHHTAMRPNICLVLMNRGHGWTDCLHVDWMTWLFCVLLVMDLPPRLPVMVTEAARRGKAAKINHLYIQDYSPYREHRMVWTLHTDSIIRSSLISIPRKPI